MVNVEMACYKIESLNMINNIKDIEMLEGINSSYFSVDFKKDNTIAIATLRERIETEGKPSKFCIDLILEGVFSIDGVRTKAQKEEADRRCYDDLFPVAEQIIKYLTMNSGMSEGVSIPKQSPQRVNLESDQEEKDEKIIHFPKDQ